MKELLESGVHFGHQTRRWNPKMKPFIYTTRNGIHIIDLQRTVEKGEKAYSFIVDTVREGGKVLFVGTKKQAQEAVKREAIRSNQFYVTNRWLGGMLTNYETIKKSIYRLKKLEKMEVDGTFEALTKKEVLNLTREKDKLEKVLGGIKEMGTLPEIVFVIDPRKEYIAVNEAKKLNIPVVAVVDTNCDPTIIDYPIPGNDDAIRAINLFAKVVADAVVEGENLAGKEMAENISMGKDEEEGEKPKEKKLELKKPKDIKTEKVKEKPVETKTEEVKEKPVETKTEEVKEEPVETKTEEQPPQTENDTVETANNNNKEEKE